MNAEKVSNFEKTLISLRWLEGLPKLGTFLTVFYNIVQAKSSESYRSKNNLERDCHPKRMDADMVSVSCGDSE